MWVMASLANSDDAPEHKHAHKRGIGQKDSASLPFHNVVNGVIICDQLSCSHASFRS